MTIDDDQLDRWRETAREGLQQGDSMLDAFKAGQWSEAHRELLCEAVLRLVAEVERKREEVDNLYEWIGEKDYVIDQLMYRQISEQVQEGRWE